MFAVLAAVVTDVVLIQGAELRAGGRQAVFLVGALEAGENTLTKQILWLLLHEMVHPQLVLHPCCCCLHYLTKNMSGSVTDEINFKEDLSCFAMLQHIVQTLQPHQIHG